MRQPDPLAHRARPLVRSVGAGVGLGQREAAQPLACAQLRQVLVALLLGAPFEDRGADQRGLHRDHGADRGVAAADLLHDQPIADVVEACAAVLLRHDRAEIALRCDLRDEVQVEVVVARVLARALDQLVVCELARGRLDQALLVGQVEVHVSVRAPVVALVRTAWGSSRAPARAARSPARCPRSAAAAARASRGRAASRCGLRGSGGRS